jgi:hypothetical protein
MLRITVAAVMVEALNVLKPAAGVGVPAALA